MGNKPSVMRVAVIGLTETGKSNFLAHVSREGHGFSDDSRPTYGTRGATYQHARNVLVEFTEYGEAALVPMLNCVDNYDAPQDAAIAQTVRAMQFDAVWLFVDNHDSRTELLQGRDLAMAFALKALQKKLPLVVVQNNGRPGLRRRKIVRNAQKLGYEWEANTLSSRVHSGSGVVVLPPPERACPWSALLPVLDDDYLRVHAFSNVTAVQISAQNNEDETTLHYAVEWSRQQLAKQQKEEAATKA